MQIAMLRQSLVEEERWVSPAHFNRVLALYQVLPGPEAHELCVYFGMLSRGRIGGVVAGLGFMLPGFILMFLLSWLYVRFGLNASGTWAVAFAAVQAAVAGVIVRAVHRIGSHVVKNAWLWAIALLAAIAHLLDVHFGLILLSGGLIYLLAERRRLRLAACAALVCAVGLMLVGGYDASEVSPAVAGEQSPELSGAASLPQLLWAGLKAGALTFGGAYTMIPFLQQDAVYTGAWMTNEQFLDGVALGGLLPAPLIIFATFVGYLGGGPAGALVLTAAIFLPAFVLTLIGHHPLERLVSEPRVRGALDGVTAAVVGLIGGTAVSLSIATVTTLHSAAVFAAAIAVAFLSNHKLSVPAIVAAAAAWGLALSLLTS